MCSKHHVLYCSQHSQRYQSVIGFSIQKCMPLPSVRSLSTRLQRVQQWCMCILANGAEVAQSRTSRSFPAHFVSAKPSTALVHAVHQGSAFPSANSSLLIRHRQQVAQVQAVRIRFPQSGQLSSAPSLLRSQVENSRGQASSGLQRHQATAFRGCHATANPIATLTDALQAQQKTTACLVGLASAIATLLFNPSASFASEVCQVLLCLCISDCLLRSNRNAWSHDVQCVSASAHVHA